MNTASMDGKGNLSLSARVIPIPTTISPEAQKALASPMFTATVWPAVEDKAGWKSLIAERDKFMAEMFFAARKPFRGSTEAHALGQSTLYELTPESIPERNRHRAILYVHGGAYVMGGGELAAIAAEPLAKAMQCKVYSIDYRMPPDHPFPAAIDDLVEAWRYVVKRHAPANVGVTGVSAGGGLGASGVLKCRDLGLPLPGAAVWLTPESDLTESGDTFETNRDIDVVLKKRLTEPNLLYANGHDLRDPYLSACFGDFTRGYPPTLLVSGTRDLFLSNTVTLHRALRRAGIEAELHVFEAMPHGGFFGAPEDAESVAEQLRFLDKHLGTTGK